MADDEQKKENEQANEEEVLEQTLRPQTLGEYVGQDHIKENLNIFLAAAKKRKESVEHVLLYGPAGLGKTTLAHVIGHELGVLVKTTSGPALERAGDLAAILTNLSNGDILFIDEIHRLPRTVEEVLYPAMEDFVFDIVIGKGPSARTVQLQLPRFTLIGATTKAGSLSSPFRSRFGALYRLDFYTQDDIEKIVDRSAKLLSIPIDKSAIGAIASRSRQTPRVANRLLKRVRDYSQVKEINSITATVAVDALKKLEIDERGLEQIDRRILEIMTKKFGGGPVGLHALAASLGEDQDTIADVYEPYLLQAGFITRTPKGRVATALTYDHLSITRPENLEDSLF
jgi:Holliday junction DNA helicase RuvB